MGINHSYALFYWLREHKPSVVVESGVWKGATSWLIQEAAPSANLLCFDVDFSNLIYKSPSAQYYEKDFHEFDWRIDLSNSLVIFDDHQNSLERIKSAFWFGFSSVIIDDNYPLEEGDAYSLNHMKHYAGMHSFQLSRKFQGGVVARMRRKMDEAVFRRHVFRQSQIVKAQEFDWSNLLQRVEFLEEFPPLYPEKNTPGGKLWSNVSPQPAPCLLKSPLPGTYDYSYTYVSYLRFRRGC